MHFRTYSAAILGIDAQLIEIECDIQKSNSSFRIIGFSKVAQELKARIESACYNSLLPFSQDAITINLAAHEQFKFTNSFDLPIIVGIFGCMDLFKLSKKFINETILLGEVSLVGEIRPDKCALSIAYDLKKLGKKRLIVSHHSVSQLISIPNIEIIGIRNLQHLIEYLKDPDSYITPVIEDPEVINSINPIDYSDVKGQHQAKRALQIAAAGRHNILFVGPPGSGKSMLAKRLPTIMPNLSHQERMEIRKIYSSAGLLDNDILMIERPFRAPHHTISSSGLIGGGHYPKPGEISLAHNGILFLDELTEFKRDNLEALRQPFEDGYVNITRAKFSLKLPSSFLFVGAYNPCPCGYNGDPNIQCQCPSYAVLEYQKKLSGPLLSRIDLHIKVQPIEYSDIKDKTNNVSSADLKCGVQRAIENQYERFNNTDKFNNNITIPEIEQFCTLERSAEDILKTAFEKFNLNMRSYHKILKVARTIADIDDNNMITQNHIKEALMYRPRGIE